jgi:hypothetical protein
VFSETASAFGGYQYVAQVRDAKAKTFRKRKGIVAMTIPFAFWPRRISKLLNDIHAGVNNDGRPANDDAIIIVAIIVITAPLMYVGPAAIPPSLSRRQAAITPTYFVAADPAWRAAVAVICVILVTATALPAVIITDVSAVTVAVAAAAVIVVAEMFAMLSFAFIPAVIGQGTGSGNS